VRLQLLVTLNAEYLKMQTDLFSGISFISSGFLNITPRNAYAEILKGNATLIDVREEYLTDVKRFDLPIVFYFPLSTLKNNISKLPHDVPLIIADAVGIRSHETMEILKANGFENIVNLAGGIVDWERDGLPVKIDELEKLDGACICQLKPYGRLKK